MAKIELWGIEDVAEYLGIKVGTAYSWKNRGKLPKVGWTISGRPVWRANVVRQWKEGGGGRRRVEAEAEGG